MKHLIFILTVAILFSCSKDDNQKTNEELLPAEYPQTWKLVKMSGNIPNSETTGDKMTWQEVYTFNADKTFIKTRKQTGVTTEAIGTYTLVSVSNENFIELTFKTGTELVGNCTSNDSNESLWIVNNQLIGTWSMCDGPGLVYEFCSNCSSL